MEIMEVIVNFKIIRSCLLLNLLMCQPAYSVEWQATKTVVLNFFDNHRTSLCILLGVGILALLYYYFRHPNPLPPVPPEAAVNAIPIYPQEPLIQPPSQPNQVVPPHPMPSSQPSQIPTQINPLNLSVGDTVININDNEPILLDTFKNLIAEQWKKYQFYSIAIITSWDGTQNRNYPFDANTLSDCFQRAGTRDNPSTRSAIIGLAVYNIAQPISSISSGKILTDDMFRNARIILNQQKTTELKNLLQSASQQPVQNQPFIEEADIPEEQAPAVQHQIEDHHDHNLQSILADLMHHDHNLQSILADLMLNLLNNEHQPNNHNYHNF